MYVPALACEPKLIAVPEPETGLPLLTLLFFNWYVTPLSEDESPTTGTVLPEQYVPPPVTLNKFGNTVMTIFGVDAIQPLDDVNVQ